MEVICERFKYFKGFNIGLFDCCIVVFWCEWYGYIYVCGFSCLFDIYVISQNNCIGDIDVRFSGNFF